MSADVSGRGIPFVVSAPSGTGKTTVCRRVVERDRGIAFSISHTTRPMRAGEANGRDYHFVARDEFLRLVAQGAFVEHAEYAGNLYGTSWAALDAPLWALEGAEEQRVSSSVTKKYLPLTDYLEQLEIRQITMSFDHLGKLVGGLPNSAYQYQAWWQNKRGHSQALGWTLAGFNAEPDLRSRTVIFRRV